MKSALPDSWVMANLFDVCHPTQWKTISIGELSLSGFPVYGANGRIGFYDKFTHENPTIMITCRGATCGNIHISVPFSYINGNAMALDGLNGVFCDLKFLAYFLETRGLRDVISGSAQPQITRSSLSPINVALAPRNEQTRIVEKLEELLSDLDAGVAELKAAQKKLVQYRQSLLKAAVEGALTAPWREVQRKLNKPQETGAQLLQRILTERRARWEAKQLAKFAEQGKAPAKDWQKKYPEPVKPDTSGLPGLPEGWVWASVDELTPDDLANGRSVPSAESGAKVLRLTAVKSGHIELNQHKHGDWDEAAAKPYAVVEGDLLIVRGNGSLSLVGRAGLVGKVHDQIAYPDTMIRLRVLEAFVSASWIGLLWDSQLIRSHIERRARTSAGIYKISQPDIVSAPIPVPPVHEQQAILLANVSVNEVLVKTQFALEDGFKQAAAQRKNILKAAFSGQLVTQDPKDELASALLARIRAERAESSSRPAKSVRKPKTPAKA